jgi:hypothetical protein
VEIFETCGVTWLNIQRQTYKCLGKLKPDERKFIESYIELFNTKFGGEKWVTAEKWEAFEIDVGKEFVPKYYDPYEYFGEEKDFLIETIKTWFKLGIIRHSNSKSAVPLIVAKDIKLDGVWKYRCAPNYKLIVDDIKNWKYPLPGVRETVDRINGAWKCKIDAKWGHLRVPLREGDEWITAFSTPWIEGLGNHFEFTCMPWGLNNSGRKFQYLMMNSILKPNENFNELLQGSCAEVIQDDCIGYATSREELWEVTKKLLDRYLFYGIVPNWDKCEFFSNSEMKAFGGSN